MKVGYGSYRRDGSLGPWIIEAGAWITEPSPEYEAHALVLGHRVADDLDWDRFQRESTAKGYWPMRFSSTVTPE